MSLILFLSIDSTSIFWPYIFIEEPSLLLGYNAKLIFPSFSVNIGTNVHIFLFLYLKGRHWTFSSVLIWIISAATLYSSFSTLIGANILKAYGDDWI